MYYLKEQYKYTIYQTFYSTTFYAWQVKFPLLQKKIAGLVDRILAMKKNDPETDTSALESEIDTLVYCLYGLSDTEIAQIENHDKHKARGKNKD